MTTEHQTSKELMRDLRTVLARCQGALRGVLDVFPASAEARDILADVDRVIGRVDAQTTLEPRLVVEKTFKDAPPEYTSEESSAWASGFNAARSSQPPGRDAEDAARWRFLCSLSTLDWLRLSHVPDNETDAAIDAMRFIDGPGGIKIPRGPDGAHPMTGSGPTKCVDCDSPRVTGLIRCEEHAASHGRTGQGE